MFDNKIINVGLYIRVSTERQVKEGYSVSAQKENLSNFVKQQGWNIYDIYADKGISGKNIDDRSEVKRLINDIKEKKIDVVAIYKFDRLTRDSKDTEEIIELIQQFGIQVFTLGGGNIDVKTASGRFAIRINGAVAQLEREQTIERIKVAFKQKVKQGYTLACATTCYGYNRNIHEKEMKINQEEARVVKRIFKMYIEGKTFTQICNILNVLKIPTKKNGKIIKKYGINEKYTINGIWMPKTIKLILTNPTYIGKVRYHIGKEDGFIANGKHKPIISNELWNEVQLKISKKKHTYKTKLPKDDVYFCGTLICGICGHKLTTSRTNRIKKDGTKTVFYAYRCINREKKLCTSLGISHTKVEKAFIDYIDKIEELKGINKVKIQSFNEDYIQLESLNKSLDKIKNKKNQIMQLFINDSINYEQLKYMNEELDCKTNLLKNEIANLERRLLSNKNIDKKELATSIKDHWIFLSNKEKLEFLNNFVEKIIIVNKDKTNKKAEILNVKFYDE